MNQYNYQITMTVPLGERKGSMTVYEDKGILNGTLSILGRNELFSGTLKSNGTCEITGKLVSLLQTMPYQAIGKMNKERIILDIYSGQEKISILGKGVNDETDL